MAEHSSQKLSGLDGNLIFLLDALLSESSVSKAAQRTGRSASAVSHGLAKLRDSLGDPILVREGRGMALTPRAARMAPAVRRLAEELAQVLTGSEFSPVNSTRTFRVRLTGPTRTLLAVELSRLMFSEAPDARLIFTGAAEAAQLDPDLWVGEPPADKRPGSAELYEDDLVCLLGPGIVHKKRRVGLVDFCEFPHLICSAEPLENHLVESALREHRVSRKVVRVASHLDLAAGILRSEPVLWVTGRNTARRLFVDAPRDERRLPFPIPTYPVSMTWNAASDNDPAAVWLRELVLRSARSLRIK